MPGLGEKTSLVGRKPSVLSETEHLSQLAPCASEKNFGS